MYENPSVYQNQLSQQIQHAATATQKDPTLFAEVAVNLSHEHAQQHHVPLYCQHP